jgi:cell wall assembly regulator SMI1
MATIGLTEESFQINHIEFTFPINIAYLVAVLGLCRHTIKPKNNIFTWDHAGLMAYSQNGEMVDGLLLVWDHGKHNFYPQQSFQGEFTLNKEDAIAYYNNNKQARVKLFKGDEGGAIILNGISAWFDMDGGEVKAIEIRKHEVLPEEKAIPAAAVADEYKYLISLWKEWIDQINKVVPVDNKYYNLTRGISEQEMQEAKEIKTFTMPDQLLNFYAIHNVEYNGVTAAFSFSVNGWQYDLLPFEMIPERWEEIDDLQFGEDIEEADLKNFSEKVKATDYANPNWIPIAEGRNGDFLLFDTDPSDKGKYGQIIELQNESWERQVVANSLEELLQNEINAMKSGDTEKFDFILGK